MISSRYGKSPALGALVTLIALVAHRALHRAAAQGGDRELPGHHLPGRRGGGRQHPRSSPTTRSPFWVAAGLALFSILFGTRNIDANERHHGVVAAIALEAVVKLAALLAVGLWVVFGMAATPAAVFDARARQPDRTPQRRFGARWVTLLLPRRRGGDLPAAPVPGHGRRELRRAPPPHRLVAVPALPVPDHASSCCRSRIAGLQPAARRLQPRHVRADAAAAAPQQDTLALLAFLGGFSSATSMVIVVLDRALDDDLEPHRHAAGAALRAGAGAGARRRAALPARHAGASSIVLIVLLGFLYFRLSGTSDALAAIGLISFCGVAQFLPAWSAACSGGAPRTAAPSPGWSAGFVIWAYTLFLPSFGGFFLMPASVIADGPFGWAWLRPHALFGLDRPRPAGAFAVLEPGVNIAAVRRRLARCASRRRSSGCRAALFVDVFRRQPRATSGVIRRTAPRRRPAPIAERILGPDEARAAFEPARRQGAQAVHRRRRAHLAARAQARRQRRRRFGARADLAGRHQRDDQPRRADADRRRDPAGARLLRRARGAIAPARGDRRRPRAANERFAPRRPEGRLPEPGQPRGAHADDVDPLVQRHPAQQTASCPRAGRLRFLRDHPGRKPAPDPAARQHARPEPARDAAARPGKSRSSTRKPRSTMRWRAARPWPSAPASR